MNNDREAFSLRADCLGVIASTLCFVHCILTPVVLSLSAVSVHYLHSEEKLHRLLAVLIAGLGGFAGVSGYGKHRRSRVLLLMSCGLILIFAGAYWGDRLPSHFDEAAATLIGSSLMITAHIINHTFCNNRDRCNESSG